MSELIIYPITIAICYLVAAIGIYAGIYYELKKAQRIWREKRK